MSIKDKRANLVGSSVIRDQITSNYNIKRSLGKVGRFSKRNSINLGVRGVETLLQQEWLKFWDKKRSLIMIENRTFPSVLEIYDWVKEFDNIDKSQDE